MIGNRTTRKILNIFKTEGPTTFGGTLYQVNYQRIYWRNGKNTSEDLFCGIVEVIPGACDGKPAPVCRNIELHKMYNDMFSIYSYCTQFDLNGPYKDDIRKDMKLVTSSILKAWKKGRINLD